MSQLPISNRTVFLDTRGVRAARGITTDKVNALVESGSLLWVFNLGLKQIKSLRFWCPELTEPGTTDKLQLDQVISKILPERRQSFEGSEIGILFLVSRPTVKRIGSECQGTISNRRLLTVSRARLAEFLRRRWIGAENSSGQRKATRP